jgi:hypothetical protein
MRRRDFALAVGAAGAALMAPGAVWAQDEGEVEGDVMPTLMTELEALQGQRIDAVGRSNIAADNRSVLRTSGTDAGHAIPPLTDELRALLAQENYWELPAAQRPQSTWVGDRAPDYQHLVGLSLSSAQFELSAGVLTRLAAANAFALNDDQPLLVFGLRGCKMLSGESWSPWAATHRLEAASPAHIDCQCVIGLLRKSDSMIALFRGTTVPAVAAMYKSLPANGGGTSLLPTGLYPYQIGTLHAGTRARQPGILRIDDNHRYCVLRTPDDLTFDAYSENDAWTRGAYHQIHAGGSNLERPGSNGCQTIPGGYANPERTRAFGAFAEFRRAAGLVDSDDAPLPDETRPKYQYMLLTGREAALAYQGGRGFENGYRRLRPGSSGEAVRNLQRQLFAMYTGIQGASADGQFGMLTSFAVLLNKKETEQEFTSPIVSI